MNQYYFFDRGILNGYRMANVTVEVNRLKKDIQNNPLFWEDYFSDSPRRWEVRYDNGYPNVIYDEECGIYRCYYTLFTYDESSAATTLEQRKDAVYKPKESRITSLCYAQSKDGIHFEKPSLGLIEFEGSKENNILLRYAHGTGIMLDRQETDRKKRFKLVTKVEYHSSRNFMAVAFSEDGIHFSDLIEWPEYNPAGDAHNFPFRDPCTGKYYVVTRIWKNGVRICAISESTDFINWSKPVEILRGEGFENQVYSMPVLPYNGIYLGFASMYHEGDATADNFDTVDVELQFASSLDHWDHVAPGQKLIPRGEGVYPEGEFDCGCIYSAAPVEKDGKLWFYYMGGNGRHTDFRETSLARGWLEKDKLAGCIPKKRQQAFVTTSHFVVYGEEVSILADLEENGELAVALGTKSGKVYEGFEKENCRLERQKDGYYKISYEGRRLTELRNLPVSFHVYFKNAKIYALHGELESYKLKY